MHAEVEGHRLDFEEMLEMLILLLLAGNETTTNLIANSVVQLVDHPDAMAALRADPGKVPSGIEEVLRYDSPIQADPRRASREVEIRGVKIPTDATVFSWLGSANRDERVFERPEEFLVDRDPNRHISFGFGQHYCLGANLARLETRVALRGLLARTSDIQLTNREPLPLHPSFIFRGPQALPVLLKAA